MDGIHRRNARVFKALCDPKRLAILELLRGGESGLVDSRQEGKWTHYRLSPDGCAAAIRLLEQLTTPDA